MCFDDGGRHPQHGGAPAKDGSVVRLQRGLLRLARPVRDGALAGGLAGLLVVVQPDAGLLRYPVDLDLPRRGEERLQLLDLDVFREVLHEDLHLRVDPRVFRAGLPEAASDTSAASSPWTSSGASPSSAASSSSREPTSISASSHNKGVTADAISYHLQIKPKHCTTTTGTWAYDYYEVIESWLPKKS